MEEVLGIKRKGFLPCGTNPTGEQGNTVLQLDDGSIIFDAPHHNELDRQTVPKEKIPRIQWDN
jgi:hypothetical protein